MAAVPQTNMPRSRGRRRSSGRGRKRRTPTRKRGGAAAAAAPTSAAPPRAHLTEFLAGVRRAGWVWPVSVDEFLLRDEHATQDAHDTVLVAPEWWRGRVTREHLRWLLQRPLLYHAHSGRYLSQGYDVTAAQGLLAATLALKQDRFPDRGMATATAPLCVAGWCNFWNGAKRGNRGVMERAQRVYCVGVNQLRIERLGLHDAPLIFPKTAHRGTCKVAGRLVDLQQYRQHAARAYATVLALALQQSARHGKEAVAVLPLLHVTGMSPGMDTKLRDVCELALAAAVKATHRARGSGRLHGASLLDERHPVRVTPRSRFLVLGYPTSTFNMPGNEYYVGAGSVSTEAALGMASTLPMLHNPQANLYLKWRLEHGQVTYV